MKAKTATGWVTIEELVERDNWDEAKGLLQALSLGRSLAATPAIPEARDALQGQDVECRREWIEARLLARAVARYLAKRESPVRQLAGGS